jgi:pimeloyl-ACP methyl ester carboxylesterase
MAKALINGINVHYQRRGAGPDVVLVHGITSCLAQWYVEILPALAREYCTTVYDLRGHGLTDVTESGYSSLSMAADLLALLDHLGIEKPVLVGHSFGGAIALHHALLHPERVKGIVVLDTGLACLRYLRVIREWEGWQTYGPQLAQFGITLDRFLAADSKQDVTDFIRLSLSVPLQAGFRKGQSPLTPRIQRLLDQTRMGYEFREICGLTEETLQTISTPVLAVYGGTSPYEKMARRLNELLPRCRYEVLAESGHFYAIEEPSLVLQKIAAFLREPDAYVPALRSSASFQFEG